MKIIHLQTWNMKFIFLWKIKKHSHFKENVEQNRDIDTKDEIQNLHQEIVKQNKHKKSISLIPFHWNNNNNNCDRKYNNIFGIVFYIDYSFAIFSSFFLKQ